MINGVRNIQSQGDNCLKFTTISSNLTAYNNHYDNNVMNVEINGTNNYTFWIQCSVGDVCKIRCYSHDACTYLVLDCYGMCCIECNKTIGINCPNVTGTYFYGSCPTLMPSTEPSGQPTHNPSHYVYPTIYPSTAPLLSPTELSLSGLSQKPNSSTVETIDINHNVSQVGDHHNVSNFLNSNFTSFNTSLAARIKDKKTEKWFDLLNSMFVKVVIASCIILVIIVCVVICIIYKCRTRKRVTQNKDIGTSKVTGMARVMSVQSAAMKTGNSQDDEDTKENSTSDDIDILYSQKKKSDTDLDTTSNTTNRIRKTPINSKNANVIDELQLVLGKINGGGLNVSNATRRTNSTKNDCNHCKNNANQENKNDESDIIANIGEIEGLDLNNINNEKTSLDINNWKQWNNADVNQWIRFILKDNMFCQKDIDQFMTQVFVQMRMSGKILVILKSNDEFWNSFKSKIENYSFGIFVAIGNQIRKLPD